MNRDQALAKIKKCLALAKSANPNEAATAMRQAQALMAQHCIQDADIALTDVKEEMVRTRTTNPPHWEVCLAGLVGNAFGCIHHVSGRQYLVHGQLRTRRWFVYIGTGSAPDVATYAYDVLSKQCASQRLAHIKAQSKNCKPATKTARGDMFALGWVAGVSNLLERFAGTENNTRLLAQYVETHYPNMAEAKIKDRTKGRNVSYADRLLGIQAGAKAELNHGIGSAKPAGLLV